MGWAQRANDAKRGGRKNWPKRPPLGNKPAQEGGK